MKKLIFLCCFCWGQVQAQQMIWSKEINQDIWKPFSEAYANLNVKQYMGLHTQNLIRTVGSEKQIKNLKTYTQEVDKFFENIRVGKAKIAIQFRFLERIANAETASERGIYEFSFTSEKGETQKSYGKFHVFLRKEKGKWKIAIDYDSNENGTISVQDFQNASPMGE
jgi:ketosteroid isomerase-like protein